MVMVMENNFFFGDGGVDGRAAEVIFIMVSVMTKAV